MKFKNRTGCRKVNLLFTAGHSGLSKNSEVTQEKKRKKNLKGKQKIRRKKEGAAEGKERLATLR